MLSAFELAILLLSVTKDGSSEMNLQERLCGERTLPQLQPIFLLYLGIRF